jgi:hypothetical protein
LDVAHVQTILVPFGDLLHYVGPGADESLGVVHDAGQDLKREF